METINTKIDADNVGKQEKFKTFWVKSVNNWICDADYNGKALKDRNPFPSFRRFYFIRKWEDLIGFTTREGITNVDLTKQLLNNNK